MFGSLKPTKTKAVHVDQWIVKQSDQYYKTPTLIKHLVLLKRLMWVATIWALIANEIAVNYQQKIGFVDLRQKFLARHKVFYQIA